MEKHKVKPDSKVFLLVRTEHSFRIYFKIASSFFLLL